MSLRCLALQNRGPKDVATSEALHPKKVEVVGFLRRSSALCRTLAMINPVRS
jgi:hypothetical protein